MEKFEEIYREYHRKVLAYIRGKVPHAQDAEDLCSAVFEKILRNMEAYDAGKATSAWIFRITQNTVTDYYRTTLIQEPLDENLPSPADSAGDLLRRETLSTLADALRHLRQQEHDIIILHYYTGYSLKELSERMGIPYRTVKLRKRTALEQLRFLMRDHA